MRVLRSVRGGMVAVLVGVIGTAGLSGLAAAADAVAAPVGAPAPQDPGSWSVEPAPDGGARVTWTSPDAIPVGGDRPEFLLDGVSLGAVLVEADGRTLRLADTLAEPPDPADLDVELSGRLLDEPAAPVAPSAPVDPAPAGPVLPGDPTAPGPYDVAAADYQLPSFGFGGMHDLEMVGHVVAPVAAPGPRPVVLLLHGRHDSCYVPGHPNSSADTFSWPCRAPAVPVPSHLGYTYVQELLASQGYLTVSVAADGINAQDGRQLEGGASARAALVRRHLDAFPDLDVLQELGVTPDLDRVILIGHSRGGEGVNRASETIPLDAPYRVVGQVLIGPTDFGRQAAAYVPTITVLPFCDGDVSDLQGQLYTDVARDAAPDDQALHSTVLVMGANHNFFNTEWTPGISAAPSFDDNGEEAGPCATGQPTRLTAEQQRTVGAAYLAAAVATFDGSADYLPLFDGSGARVAPTADFDIRSQTLGAHREVRRPGAGLDADPADPSTRLCVGRLGRRDSDCLQQDQQLSWTTPHFTGFGGSGLPTRKAVELTWTGDDPDGRLLLQQPLDLYEAERLEVRMLLPLGADAADFDVALGDGSGHTATVALPAGEGLPGEPVRDFGGTAVAQVLRVPLAGLDPALDATDVRSVTLVAHGGGSGVAWVLDLSGVPAGATPATPAKRLRTLSFGRLKVDEGDGGGVRDVEIPYTVSGASGVDAVVRILTTNVGRQGYPVSDRAVDVSVPAGSTGGSVTMQVAADRLDDLNVKLSAEAYPVSGLMPTAFEGVVRVVDDDPTPALRTTVRTSPVAEGHSLVFVAHLARAVDYWTTVELYPVKQPGARLAIGDLPRKFVKRWFLPPRLVRPRHPYAGSDYRSYGGIRAGKDHSTVLRLPLRVDHHAEGIEQVTFRVRASPTSRVSWVGAQVQDR